MMKKMNDDLGDKIKRLKERNAKDNYEKERHDAHSTFGQTAREVWGVQKFILQFTAGFVWLWWKFGRPVVKLIYARPWVKYPILVFFFILLAGSYSGTGLLILIILIADGNYRKLWNKYAYFTDKYNTRQFSVKRAGFTIAATLLAFYFG